MRFLLAWAAVATLGGSAESETRAKQVGTFAGNVEGRAGPAGLVERRQRARFVTGCEIDDTGVVETARAVAGIEKLCTRQVHPSRRSERQREVVPCGSQGRIEPQ